MAMPLSVLNRPRLALEIGVVLVIKILLLSLIWSMWFSRPVARHMQLPPHEVARQLLSAPSAGDLPQPEADNRSAPDSARDAAKD